MAKEFKEYDKKYAAYKGKLMDYELQDTLFDLSLADLVDSWDQVNGFEDTAVLPLASYTQDEARQAVYWAEGAEDWQKFRVSLKGNSTCEKLYRLAHRFWVDRNNRFERIRIDNYIGALRRGGQLDSNNRIIK